MSGKFNLKKNVTFGVFNGCKKSQWKLKKHMF